MTDKTDPRLDALTSALKVQWGKGWMNDDGQSPSDVLADLDAADRAAGMVRVDTTDKMLRRDITAVIAEWIDARPDQGWDGLTDEILAALREAP